MENLCYPGTVSREISERALQTKAILAIIAVLFLLGATLFVWALRRSEQEYPAAGKERNISSDPLSADDIARITSYRTKYQKVPGPSNKEVADVARILIATHLHQERVEQILGRPSSISVMQDARTQEDLTCWAYDVGDSRRMTLCFDTSGTIRSIRGAGVGFDVMTDQTYDQLQRRYGNSVARASIQFRSMRPTQEAFYRKGGRMHHLDTLLPCIRPGMLQDEVKLLLGESSGTRTVGHKDYWNYVLFYSQALTLQFDEHHKLTNLDGYGKAEWRNTNFDHLVTLLKRGTVGHEVDLILGAPDRVARSENGLTTWFYEQQDGLATAVQFEDERLISVTGHGQETWNRVNENDNQKVSGPGTS